MVIGDIVRTKCQMYFVEASHPETGDKIETFFPRGHYFIVCGIGEDTIDVELPDGYVATLSRDDIEC